MLANIIRNAKKTGIGGGGGGIVTGGDPYYSAVSLLLPMDGTNGSTTFTDSSLNALTVTAVGNTQISTSQSKYGGASGYFDGTGDYLSISPNTAIDLSSGDFTIEFWIRPAPKTNAVDAAFGYSNYACMFYHNGTNWTLEMSSTGFSNQLVISFAVTLNTWQHIAIVRSGTSVVVYKDGVSSASGTFTGTVATSGRTLRIGDNGNSQNINGYIDDFRISLFARYTSNFTPPTTALPTTASSTPADPYYGYTSLLLHMDGSSGSTNFADSGPNALAVTAVGNAQISTTQSKYGGASGYFDGSTGYLSLTGNSSFQFGTGDFTVEAWVYISANAANQQTFLDTRGTATATPFTFGIYQSKLAFYDGTMRQSSATVTTGQWYHFAACRSGGTLRLFIDGISYYSASSSTNFTTGANSIYIGRGFDAAAYYTNGYIDDLRVTKYARYTSAFAPPAQAHLEYANGNDRYFSNVSLLLHMDGSNGSTIFTDNSANALAITRTGTPAISTAQSVLGGSSASFDGTGQYLSPSSSTGMLFATGDFTVEFWFYANSISTNTGPSGYTALMGFHNGGSEDWGVFARNSGVWIYGGGVYLVGGGTVSTGQWYHFAASRSGSTIRVFLNGTQVGISTSATGNYTNNAGNAFRIGDDHTATNPSFNGLIDDLRITKGVSRYSANFTPPTSAHPNA